MPNNIRDWSTCIPDEDKSFGQTLEEYLVPDFDGDLIGLALSAVVFGFLSGTVPAAVLLTFVEQVLHKTVEGGCILGTIFLGALIYLIVTLALWFDHRRTVCMDTAACAVGTIVHDPHSNGNGDLDLDIALAPFSPDEQRAAISSGLRSQTGYTPSGSVDAYISLAGLSTKDRLNVYEHAVEEYYLKWPSNRLFQQRYFVPTKHIDDLIKTNHVKAPVYRCPSDADDPAEKMPLPTPINDAVLANTFVYMPCVIEGHVVVEWLKNVRNGLIAGLVGFAVGCAVCMYYTGDEHDCAWVGSAVAAVLAFLAWLLSHLFNNPNDTKADGATDASTDDSSSSGAISSAERGDVIVAFGSWVTYMLDNQYYEIHPVHAWYLVCRGDQLFEKGTMSTERCGFDTTRLLADDYATICRMVHAAETSQPSGVRVATFGGGLAMVGGLR